MFVIIDPNTCVCCPPPLSDVAKHGQCALGECARGEWVQPVSYFVTMVSGPIDIIDGHDVFEGVKQSHY